MKSLTTASSIDFVSGYAPVPSVMSTSVEAYLKAGPTRIFREGTSTFTHLRCCLLRETEQSLIMSQNCYARALEGLRSSSSYWSLVTLYYSAFFSIKAVLGTYGCWMGGPNRWLEVVDAASGNIRLQYKTTPYCTQRGSHRVTWIAYYDTMAALSSFLNSTEAVLAKTPVNKSKTWLIDTRNDANYDPQIAFDLTREFDVSFDPADVPNCFKGRLQTMLRISKACALFAKESTLRVGLSTSVWTPEPDRAGWVRNRIINAQHPAISAFAQSELPQLEF